MWEGLWADCVNATYTQINYNQWAFPEKSWIPLLRIPIFLKLTPWIYSQIYRDPLEFSIILVYPPGIPTTFTLPPGIFHWYPEQGVTIIFLKKPISIDSNYNTYLILIKKTYFLLGGHIIIFIWLAHYFSQSTTSTFFYKNKLYKNKLYDKTSNDYLRTF